MLEWRSAPEQKCLRAETFAQRSEPTAVGFGAGQAAVVGRAAGRPAVAVGKLSIRVPITRGALVAVVELDIAKEAPVEVRAAEIDVRKHVGFGDRRAELIPRAPPGRDRQRSDSLTVYGRGRCGGGAQRPQAVSRS